MYNDYNYDNFYRLIRDNLKRIRLKNNDTQESLAKKLDYFSNRK